MLGKSSYMARLCHRNRILLSHHILMRALSARVLMAALFTMSKSQWRVGTVVQLARQYCADLPEEYLRLLGVYHSTWPVQYQSCSHQSLKTLHLDFSPTFCKCGPHETFPVRILCFPATGGNAPNDLIR